MEATMTLAQATSSVHARSLIGAPDEAILRALHRYHYLTAEQVRRRFYGPGVITYVRARLQRLAAAGYVQRVPMRRTGPAGGAPYAYRLGPQGRAYLETLGIEVLERYRPVEQPLDFFLEHSLAVADVLLAIELLTQSHPRLALAQVLHERALKRQPARVELADGRTQAVIPDGWIELHLDGRYRECLALELDRGHVEQKRWRRKVAALLAWAASPAYAAAFQTPLLTAIAVAATPGERRTMELVRWTEAELTALGREAQADLFRFTGQRADQVSPAQFLLAPTWYRPFDVTATALLEVDGTG